MADFGDYFKAIRESKGLTLRDVERGADVSNAYLSQLESGKIKQPSPITLNKLAKFYNVSYELLMGKVGYPIPKRRNAGKNESVKAKSSSNKLGEISSEEELELLQYLKFIRDRKK